jgi:uncharacterized membrane protein YgdD (TMEM256/DUF423 family)
MTQRSVLLTGGILAGLAVAIGAFGAHGLREILMANQRAETFELAVKYQFYHSLALLITGVLMNFYPTKRLSLAAMSFISGIILFSGSLYVLSLSGITKLGAVTPLGGVGFLVGWIMLVMSVARNGKG